MSENNKNDETLNKNEQKVNEIEQKNNKNVKKLTPKQQKFVDEYLIDLNATRAYKTAYPKCKTERSARTNGSRLLTNANIQEEIEKQQIIIQERTQITQDRVVKELAKIAFSNATDYVEIVTRPMKHRYWDSDLQEYVYEDGEIYEQDIVLKDTKDLTDEQKAAIACIKNTRHGISVEQCNKVEALHLLGQHLGMFKNNQPVIVNNNIPENPYNGLTIDELKALAKKKCDADDKS
jgi:phage terminase small subunit